MLRPGNTWTRAGLVAGAILLVSVLGAAGDSPKTTGTVGVLGLGLGVVAAVALARLFVLLSGVDADVPILAARLAPDLAQQRLLARWLSRARWARNVGGFAGLIVWAIGSRATGDVLVFGFGGIAVGAMVAEFHHIRPTAGRRTATLDARRVADYLPQSDRWRMTGLAAAAVALEVGTRFSDEASIHGWPISALIVMALTAAAQHRVATRPRPALAKPLRAADDVARRLAVSRNLALPATFFSLAMLGHGLIGIGIGGGLADSAGWAMRIYAVYLWWHNRRLGLDHLLDSEESAPA